MVVNNAERASKLLYYGIDKRLNPLSSDEYRELLKSFREDSEFRNMVFSIARGFSLDVLEIDETGVYLRAYSSSIFSKNRTKLNSILKDGMDKYTSLILLGLASYYFPNDYSFEDDKSFTYPITISELDVYLRTKSKEIIEKLNPNNPVVGEDQLNLLSKAYLELATVESLETNQRNTSYAYIKKVLKFLRDEKLFLEKDNEYYPLPAFKIQILNLAENEKIREMIANIKGEDD